MESRSAAAFCLLVSSVPLGKKDQKAFFSRLKKIKEAAKKGLSTPASWSAHLSMIRNRFSSVEQGNDSTKRKRTSRPLTLFGAKKEKPTIPIVGEEEVEAICNGWADKTVMVPPPELPLNVTIDGFKPNEDKEENMDLPQALPLDDRKPNDDKEEDVVAMDVDEEQALNGFDDFDTDRYLLDRSF